MIDIQMLVQLISKYVTEPDGDSPDELAKMFKPHDKDGRGTVTMQVRSVDKALRPIVHQQAGSTCGPTLDHFQIF